MTQGRERMHAPVENNHGVLSITQLMPVLYKRLASSLCLFSLLLKEVADVYTVLYVLYEYY